jgi:hypothetical protein
MNRSVNGACIVYSHALQPDETSYDSDRGADRVEAPSAPPRLDLHPTAERGGDPAAYARKNARLAMT